MRKRPEFKQHDEFIFGVKKIAKVTREEFIKYVRNTHEHMRKLTQIIQQYDQTIKEWVSKFELFDLAESVRVSNEVERISKDSERDSKIETFVEDVSDRLDNKVDTSELELYAKKEQEDWITPTLLNGATGTIKYRKNELGNTEISGRLTVVTSGAVLVLPGGYRISDSRIFIVSDSIPGTANSFKLFIASDGRLSIGNASTGSCFISVTLI